MVSHVPLGASAGSKGVCGPLIGKLLAAFETNDVK